MPETRAPNALAEQMSALATAVQIANEHNDYLAAKACLALAQSFAWHDPANRTALAREMLLAARLLDPDVRMGLDA